MAALKVKCPQCGKTAKEVSHSDSKLLKRRTLTLECGHIMFTPIPTSRPWEDIVSIDGKKLLQFQGEGYEFARQANFRVLIADQMGLGKTVQALTCLKLHSDILTPCLAVVKSSLKIQLLKETLRWAGVEFLPQIIETSQDIPQPGLFNMYITTYDLLWRINKKEIDKAEAVEKQIRKELNLSEWDFIPEEHKSRIPEIKNPFKELGIKCIILDEVQQIKNPGSKRAQQVRELCEGIPHIIACSGTPIKNNAGEYFTILNILQPQRFPSLKSYIYNYCDFSTSYAGQTKIHGLRNTEYFKEKTQDFIIRRLREEVIDDLPSFERKFVNVEFASQKLANEYSKEFQEFQDYYYEAEGKEEFFQNILAMMAKLRHITGRNKVPFAADWVEDFLLDNNRKIVVFTHHKDVAEMLKLELEMRIGNLRTTGSQIEFPLLFTSDLNSVQRNEVVEHFRTSDTARILIASTLAAGEGINLQFCQDCIVLERQWNPANEEQAESRFIRIGSKGASEGGHVDAHYFLTVGTIDEYLTELVEQKRSIMSQTLDAKDVQWDQQSLMKELADTLVKKGLKKFNIRKLM